MRTAANVSWMQELFEHYARMPAFLENEYFTHETPLHLPVCTATKAGGSGCVLLLQNSTWRFPTQLKVCY